MSLASTYLQDLRALYPSQNDRDELRLTRTGLLTSALEMTESPDAVVSPDLIQKAMISQGRKLDIPVMQKGSITIGNARSCTIAGSESTSALVTTVWKTATADISMIPSQYAKNEIGYTADLNKKIREIVEAFGKAIETDLVVALETNKSQVYGSTIVTTKYSIVGDAIQVQESQTEFFFNDIDAINFADDFYSPVVKVIANHNVMPTVNKYINQGAGNGVNLNFQFAGKDFRFTNRITNGASKNATGYFMPDGTLNLLTRIDVDAKEGHKATDGTEWLEEVLPGLPFPIGIQFKSACADKSGISGLEHLGATMVESWQISFDYAVVVPYNSDLATKPSAIRKFEFVADV